VPTSRRVRCADQHINWPGGHFLTGAVRMTRKNECNGVLIASDHVGKRHENRRLEAIHRARC